MTRVPLRRACLLAAVLLVTGCSDENDTRPDDPGAGPSPLPALVRVEYRVTGSIKTAHVVYINGVQGTTEITTEVPWFAHFETTRAQTFVYLSAETLPTNIIDGTLVAQIFVNGELFRESRARGFTPTVTASGEVIR
jgi:hypothetical protein